MVRHIDAVDPVLDRDPGVLAGGDALDDQRDVEILLDPLDVAPVELRLVDPRVVDAHPAALMALGDVALAPAVAVGVDGQAERGVALVDRAADMIVDPGRIAPHIKLEDAEPVGRGLGGLVEPRLRHRGEDHPVAEIPRRRRDGGAAARLEILQGADRRAEHRDAQFATEQSARAIDVGDVAQHARAKADRIEREAIARQRRLGLRAADQIIPIVAVEVLARDLDELMKVLEALLEIVVGHRRGPRSLRAGNAAAT